MSKQKKILLLILILILLAIIGFALYFYSILHSVTNNTLNSENLAANSHLSNKVINVALFGIDGRDDVDVEGDRSDVIVIGTLDTVNNSVKITSVMRDTYSKICYPETSQILKESIYAGDIDGIEWEIQEDEEEQGTENGDLKETENTQVQEDGRVEIDNENQSWVAEYNKINAAYSEGGVEASIKTLNENFDLNITDYVTVDFTCLMETVDALGGIEIDIPNADVLYWTNEYLKESNGFGQRNDPDLTKTGVQTLTGAQALAFARNRYSDSDFGRAQRQREVIEAIFEKAKSIDPLTALNLVNRVYPYVQTSLSISQITQYAQYILNNDFTFDSFQIPTNNYGSSGFLDKIWYLFPDTLLNNVEALHQFIYGTESDFKPSENCQQISQVIEDIYQNQAYDRTEHLGSQEAQKMQESQNAYDTQTQNQPTEEQDYVPSYDPRN